MRLAPPAALLAALAALLAVAACAPDPAAPGPPALAEADAPAAGPAFTVATDSLVARDSVLRFSVALAYPQLRGLAGGPVAPSVRAVNAAIRDTVRALAADLRPVAPPAGTGPDYPVEVTGGVQRSFVSDDVLSAVVLVRVYTGGPRPSALVLPLTYDLRTGRPLAASDLLAGTAWADTLARRVDRAVLARRAPGDSTAAVALDAETIRRGTVGVVMGRDSLRVVVPPGQVSPGSGALDVGVPYPAVRPFSRPGTVLARRAAR